MSSTILPATRGQSECASELRSLQTAHALRAETIDDVQTTHRNLASAIAGLNPNRIT